MHVNFYKDTHCGMVCDIKNKKNKTKMTNNGKIQKKITHGIVFSH